MQNTKKTHNPNAVKDSTAAAVSYYRSACELLETRLDGFLPGEQEAPQPLHRAMRHAVFSGGKRLRPRLLIAVAAACGASGCTKDERELVITTACAVELIHTASLVHDDLPVFDNAQERRGRATVHVLFGEPLALLAGDALLSLAFEIMVATPVQLAQRTLTLLRLMSIAIGSREGVIGGQSLEESPPLSSNARTAGGPSDAVVFPPEVVEQYHAMKSAALFRLATTAGALLSGQSDPGAWAEVGSSLGLAFQLADDLYDACGQPSAAGKPMHRDAVLGHPNAALTYGEALTRSKMWWLFHRACTLAAALAPEPLSLLTLLEQAGSHFGLTTSPVVTPDRSVDPDNRA